MWKIFGAETIYIDIPDAFKNGVLAHSKEDDMGKKFAGFMDKTDIAYILNGETEESGFILKVPDELAPEDIQLMADCVMDAIKAFGQAPVAVENNGNLTEQRYKIIISNNHEPELIGIRKTPGMSSYEVFKPIIEGWDSPGRRNSSFHPE